MSEKQKQYIENKHQAIVDDFIAGIQSNTHPFVKDWEPGELILPYNHVTRKNYHGINIINLLGAGYSDPRWMTCRQGADVGATLPRGSRGRAIIFWTKSKMVPLRDEDGRKVIDEDGKQVYTVIDLQRPVLRVSHVFNASQFQGVEPYIHAGVDSDETQRFISDGARLVRKIVEKSGATVIHDQNDRAFYRPGADEIHLPSQAQFRSEAGYLSTVLHELGHWTGHPSRLNRDMSNPFGSEAYAKEELRAEFFSFLANLEYGIGYSFSNHQAYLQHWLKILRNEPGELLLAVADAEKMFAYVSSLTQEVDMSRETEEEEGVAETPIIASTADTKRHYMAVPYRQREKFKTACAAIKVPCNWDKSAKAWYIDVVDGQDITSLGKWEIREQGGLSIVGGDAQQKVLDEFAAVLSAAGLVLDTVPIMDGFIHRVPVDGGKSGSRDGAYQGWIMQARPGGWFQNFNTGERTNWSYGLSLNINDDQRVAMRAGAAAAAREREITLQAERKKSY